MVDKRAYKRAICMCEAEIIVDDKSKNNIDVSVIDLSVVDLAAGGIKFFTNDCKNEPVYKSMSPDETPDKMPELCLKLGSVHRLKLSINEPSMDVDDIYVDIKIRRADAGIGADNIRHYGASFENLSAAERIRLDEIVQYKNRNSKS